MLYIAFVCIFLSIFLFTYNKNHLSKKKWNKVNGDHDWRSPGGGGGGGVEHE